MRTPKKSIKKNKYKSLSRKWSHMRSVSRAKALHTICDNSDLCMAIGKSYDKILNFFNNFHSFEYVSDNIHRIGSDSANGVIYQIKYEHDHYNAYSVLKLSIDDESDNLMYEYLVGSFLNSIMHKTTCFIGTFGIFKFNNQYALNQVINGNKYDANINKQFLIDNLSYLDPEPNINTIHTSCQEPSTRCILIENIPSAKTLHDMKNMNEFIQHDFIFVYYQIYAGFVMLNGNFVHNDLHSDNVLVYQPFTDKYFIYEYHLQGKITTFYSPYIAKIIDYGRSYFYENEQNNSAVVLKKICQSKECKPECGADYGYYQINKYINKKYARNISADLRLISYSGSMTKKRNSVHFMNFVQQISKKVVYKSKYNTPINKIRGYPASINNIYDAYDAIYDFMINPQIIDENRQKYVDSGLYTCRGKLVIYDDGRSMEYIEM
jgi:hypothetical protein